MKLGFGILKRERERERIVYLLCRKLQRVLNVTKVMSQTKIKSFIRKSDPQI